MQPSKSGSTTSVNKKATKKRFKRGRRLSGKQAKNIHCFINYIFKVFREMHPRNEMSKMGMTIFNAFTDDVTGRIIDETKRLARFAKRKTVIVADVRSAVQLVVRGELGMHAMAEGSKAVQKSKMSRQD